MIQQDGTNQLLSNIVYAGSFDPFTEGHKWIVNEALCLADNVQIIVADNPSKTYSFNNVTRTKWITEVFATDTRVTVTYIDNIFVADYCKQHGFNVMVRGLRDLGSSSIDGTQENVVRTVNESIHDNLTTIYLAAPLEFQHISSSLVRSLVKLPGWPSVVREYVPISILNRLLARVPVFSYSPTTMQELFFHDLEQCSFGSVFHGMKQRCWTQLTDCYFMQRRYHGLYHVYHMLQWADEIFGKQSSVHRLLRLAIWFHDLYIVDEAMDAEMTSAEAMEKILTGMVRPNDIEIIHDLIISTHTSKWYSMMIRKYGGSVIESAINQIHDLDYLNLAQDSWENDLDDLSEEYLLHGVSPQKFMDGRSDFLYDLMSRESIFYTDRCKLFEGLARAYVIEFQALHLVNKERQNIDKSGNIWSSRIGQNKYGPGPSF